MSRLVVCGLAAALVATVCADKSGPVPAMAAGQRVTLSNAGLYSGQVGTCTIKAAP